MLGPRGSGKSTLLRSIFPRSVALWYDLLDLDTEARLARDPMVLERDLEDFASDPAHQWIVIDEIQKLPHLLDVVHRQIEKKRFRFALTGSSARKLKRGSANLLAGRALEKHLFPLTGHELGPAFNLPHVLHWGSLPQTFSLDEDERGSYLRTYVNTYLKEEVLIEQLVRNIAPFRAFLPLAAQCSGQILSYSKIAKDIGSDPVSVKSYFSILEDTLLGFYLPPFHTSIRKRQRQAPKFYLFDLGVKRALQNRLHVPLESPSIDFGNAFEHWIIQEIYRYNAYYECDWSLSYIHTKDHAEIDLLIDRPGQNRIALEIKATSRVAPTDARHLISLGSSLKKTDLYLFSLDPNRQKIGDVTCVPWDTGLRELFKETFNNY